MKRFTFLTFLTAAFLFSVIMITSCTKEGPAGKDGINGAVGPAGPKGTAGENGIDGKDGTAGCILCHTGGTAQGMFAQVNQWEKSVHATGGNFERNTSPCATCHTSQGFLQNVAGTYTGVAVNNPNPINCYTCHNIHKTFTPADLGLTKTAKVTLEVGGTTLDFGKGNLCATCHQARAFTGPVIDGPDFKITNNRFGGHHGPQANILAGVGLYKFTGTATYGINTHKSFVTNACVTCHMATAYGAQSGGHTMKMAYDLHGVITKNTAGCAACHTNNTDLIAEWDATQKEAGELLEQLKTILIAKGILNPADGLSIPGTFKANIAAAYVNWQLLEEDRSLGVHNPPYVIGVLKNTIAKIK